MFKQCLAFILLGFSSILMVGHDIIPHHHASNDHHHHSKHDQKDSHYSHHSHSNKHHSDSKNSSEDEGAIGDLLSHFVHTGDFSMQESSVKYSSEIGNENSDSPSTSFVDYFLFIPAVNSQSKGYNCKGPIYIPPHSNSKGLRAPPVFFS